MASLTQPTITSVIPASQPIAPLAVRSQAHPRATLRFDLLMILCALWAMAGLILDGSAHAHHLVDSFFTPWHAILYTGIFSNAVALFFVVRRNQVRGLQMWQAIPAGYEMSAVGVIICGIGGVVDLAWHSLLGIEIDFQALLSPPHLVLAFGIFLFINGAFRSAWRRPDSTARGRFALWPMVISFSFSFLVLTFFTFPVNPFYAIWADAGHAARAGSADFSVVIGFPQILLQTFLFMGCLLLAMRRWQLPFGTVAFLLGLNVLALAVIDNSLLFVPAALVAGLLADVLIVVLRPSINRLVALRVFAFSTPAILYLLYFLTVQLYDGGVSWKTAFWSGTTVIAGLVGVMLSYLMIPSPSLAVPPPEQVIPN